MLQRNVNYDSYRVLLETKWSSYINYIPHQIIQYSFSIKISIYKQYTEKGDFVDLSKLFSLECEDCKEKFLNGKGRKVVAADFVYSFRRLIDAKVASSGAWIKDSKGNWVRNSKA